MKRTIANSLCALIAVVVAGCCPCRFSARYAKPLEGTVWHLQQLRGNDVSFADSLFNVTFGSDGRLSGIGACNRFTAEWSANEKRALDVGTIASTRMFCPDADSEQTMFAELDGATHYEIDADMLLLLNNGEIRAIFKAQDDGDDSGAAKRSRRSRK